MLHAQYNGHINMAAMPFCRMDQFPKMQLQTALPTQMYAPHAFEGILELRKEKSRDAARSRRGKENYEFYELAKMLPLPGAITSQLDKASIIRLTISFLKLRDFSSHGDPPWQRDGPTGSKSNKGTPSRRRNLPSLSTEIFETHQGTHILQSLDGFVFTLSNDGRFLYISETVSIYLGLSQVEMTGSSIFDYVHSQDHQELAEQLGLNSQGYYTNTTPSGASDDSNHSTTSRAVTPTLPERTSVMNPNPSKGYDRCFCVRMKSTLTKRGVHVKSSGYRVVQVLAHMRPQFSFSLARKHPPPLLGLVAMAIALPPPTLTELVIDNDMFVTRLSPELKVTYCEPRISDMMDISADDLTNKNMYDYCHAEDLQKLRKAHVDLLGKGQVLTDYYRLMNKHGGYVWIQTCATVICNAKNAEEQNIIAINYVLSGIEYPGCVMNTNQLKVVSKTEPDQSDHSENEQGSDKDEKVDKDDWVVGRHDKQPDDNRGRHGNRRKSSSAQDEHNADMTSLDANSPVNSFDLLYQKHKNLTKETQAAVNGVVLSSTGNDLRKPTSILEKGKVNSSNSSSSNNNNNNCNNNDLKNSRRKMDRPRKRKREQMEADPEGRSEDLSLGISDGGGQELSLSGGVNPPADLQSIVTEGAVPTGSGSSPAGSRPTSTNSTCASPSIRIRSTPPSPEDLSIRQSDVSPSLLTIQTSRRRLSPGLSGTCVDVGVTTTATSTTTTAANGDVTAMQWVSTSSVTNSEQPLVDAANTSSAGSSVRDLEEAMNKHLPSLPAETDHHIRAGMTSSDDYGQSMLGLTHHHQQQPHHQQHHQQQQQQAHHHHHHHQQQQQHPSQQQQQQQKHKSTIQWVGSPPDGVSSDGLPATNLLRSLYVNRESVIRPNIYNPRPQYYSTEVVQNTLLTPPGAGTEPYKDNYVGSSAGLGQSKAGAGGGGGGTGSPSCSSYASLISSYTAGAIAVSMAGTNISDGYTMTPPSSVSPQEKYVSPFGEHQFHAAADVGMTSLRGYGAHDGGSLPIPIKPQAYPLPAHATSHVTGYDRSGGYSPASGYYGAGFTPYGHTGSPTPAHYRDTRAGNVW